MNPCDHDDERLGALIDGELGDREREELEAHLRGCARCRNVRDELRRTRADLAREFTTVIDSAPPPPAPLPARPRRGWARWGAGLAAAAAAALALVWLQEPQRIEASPLTLLRRAAAVHGQAQDVELYATVESGLLEVIEKLSGTPPEDGEVAPEHYRVLVKKPDLVLLHAVPDLRSRGRMDQGELMGYDGERLWQYDPDDAVVRFDRHVRFELGSGLGNTTVKVDEKRSGDTARDLLRYLSWDFVKTLAEEAGEHDITEITGPAARRTGRRVFRLEERPPEGGEAQWFWDRAEITIDPENNLLEQLVFDLHLAGVSLIRVKVELSRIDNGFVDEDFDFRSYVPPGTPVVAAEPGNKDG